MIRLLIIATVPVFAVGFVVNEIDPAWLTDIRHLPLQISSLPPCYGMPTARPTSLANSPTCGMAAL